MNELLNSVTIVIPTANRYRYLKRLLDYYSSSTYKLNIIIADSSNEHSSDNDVMSMLKNSGISYFRFPKDITLVNKCRDILKGIKTKYVVFCADDDFIIPQAITKCISFLEQSPGYSIAHGLYCSYYLRKNKGGEIEFVWMPSQMGRSITYDKPSERLRYHLSHYTAVTFYAVHRTDLMRLIWDETVKYTSDIRFGEVLPSALSLIYSKMAILPVFYAASEITPNSDGSISDPWHLLIRSDDFQAKCDRVISCLAEHLAKQELLAMKTSTKVARESLGAYLSLSQTHRKPHAGRAYNLLKKILEKCYLKESISIALNFKRRYLSAKYFRLWNVKKEYSRVFEKKESRFYSDFCNIKNTVIRSHINVQSP